MSRAGCPPRQILSALRLEEQDLAAVSRTIYNARAKIRRETLDGRTPIEALFDVIRDNDYVHDQRFDDQGRLTSFFFPT
jgi:hypothetical protein